MLIAYYVPTGIPYPLLISPIIEGIVVRILLFYLLQIQRLFMVSFFFLYRQVSNANLPTLI